ncbi:hypothetical protein ACFFHJ_41545 [Planotetraspora thailandica]|uniref:hypothetical protein n=1 Tax=Planotetraspora thailandica TaxID=487172 RepID=UPI0019512664|nr:hypothetical protein [Planotetraspora thailandica]
MNEPDGHKRSGPADDERGSREMSTATPEAVAEQVVQFGGRIPASLRRRARIAAAAQDKDVAEVLKEALEEYLSRRNY